MPNNDYLAPWINILLGGLPYFAAIIVHIFSVFNIWTTNSSRSRNWWPQFLAIPLISVLYPVSKFSSELSQREMSLLMIGIGIGVTLLLVLMLLLSRITTTAEGRMPCLIKIPIKGYLQWNELLLALSSIIIIFEMSIAMVLASKTS